MTWSAFKFLSNETCTSINSSALECWFAVLACWIDSIGLAVHESDDLDEHIVRQPTTKRSRPLDWGPSHWGVLTGNSLSADPLRGLAEPTESINVQIRSLGDLLSESQPRASLSHASTHSNEMASLIRQCSANSTDSTDPSRKRAQRAMVDMLIC